jgi:hypothetical protein
MPIGPNPHLDDPIGVKPFGNIECLGVIYCGPREACEAELASILAL